MSLQHARAAVRFGTGLSGRHPLPGGPEDILAELAGPDQDRVARPIEGWQTKAVAVRDFIRLRRARDDGKDQKQAFRDHLRSMQNAYAHDLGATVARAVLARHGFRERLQWFWADHFTVTGRVGYLRLSLAAYVEDAIRPYMTGKFEDLLISAATHPAMVLYLDQQASIGPNSALGRRRQGRGLNENLAREILELHTMGVGASYDQTDVRELAELLTGLGVNAKTGASRFNKNAAEPGAEYILGRAFGGDPAERRHINAALRAIARHPDTAAHIARKLVVHFVSDDPPRDVVDAVRQAYRDTGGDLTACYTALLMHPQVWEAEAAKVRQPMDYTIAALRALGIGASAHTAGRRVIRTALLQPWGLMGQPWQGAGGPDGWPEVADHWITPQGLAARINWAMTQPAALMQDLPDPRQFVEVALGPLASARVRFAAEAAESRADGIGLILSSAEFQRR